MISMFDVVENNVGKRVDIDDQHGENAGCWYFLSLLILFAKIFSSRSL